MGRRHGVAAVSRFIKSYAKSHQMPHSGVPEAMVRHRVSTTLPHTSPALPGAKVWLKPNESVHNALMRLGRDGKKYGHGKGVVVPSPVSGRRRRNFRGGFNAKG